MRLPPPITAADADAAYAAAQKVVEVHHACAEFLRVGQTLAEIDAFVGETLARLKAKSCFRGYRPGGMPPFPSHACLSVNACVVHGTAGYTTEPLQCGDLLSIDIGVAFRGWIGDAAWTYSFGEPEPALRKLCDAGKDALRLGVEQLRPGNKLIEWARAVQACVETDRGLHLVRGLGGHGYGRKLHTAPHVSNVVPSFHGEWPDANLECRPGMLLAVEPMIAIGTPDITQKPRSWPIFTADGSMSVHYEHDVLVTERGPRVLTEGLENVKDVIPC